jgi:hypothetical protein
MSKRVIKALVEDIKEQLTVASVVPKLLPLVKLIARKDLPATNGEQLSPIYTVGDIRALGAFWKSKEIMEDLVGTMVARFSAQICGSEALMAFIDGPEDIVKLTHAADHIVEEAAAELMMLSSELLGDGDLDEVGVRRIIASRDDPDEAAARIQNLLEKILGGPMGEAGDDEEVASQPDGRTFNGDNVFAMPAPKTVQ